MRYAIFSTLLTVSLGASAQLQTLNGPLGPDTHVLDQYGTTWLIVSESDLDQSDFDAAPYDVYYNARQNLFERLIKEEFGNNDIYGTFASGTTEYDTVLNIAQVLEFPFFASTQTYEGTLVSSEPVRPGAKKVHAIRISVSLGDEAIVEVQARADNAMGERRMVSLIEGVDTDSDGVPDGDDNCPTSPWPVCNPDLNGTGTVVDFGDLEVFSQVFFLPVP